MTTGAFLFAGTPMLRYIIIVALLQPTLAWACKPYSFDGRQHKQLIVGSIQISINDVFNHSIETENLSIHQLANRLHIQTRKELIESQILFSKGQSFDLGLLAETERNLRRNSYLRSASVTPIQICDGEVDIQVETGDNWSLIPGFNFARAGGENEISFSVSELNLFGMGKSLDIALDYSPDRDQQVLSYYDPMLFGSKTQFSTQFQNNTDGEVQAFAFSQPFRSLDTRKSWDIRAGNTEYIQSLYNDGFINDQVSVNRDYASVELGISKGRKAQYRGGDDPAIYGVLRWSAGWQYDRLRFDATDLYPESTPEALRLYNYPYLALDLLQPDFIELSNLQVMESVEDIDVGHRLQTRIGWANETLGSSFDAIVVDTNYSKGWKKGDRILSLLDLRVDGDVTGSGVENGIAQANIKGYYFATRKNRLFASMNLTSSVKLLDYDQLVLGGATGLRGYPLNFQTGSRRARMTLEHRYFFDWYPLRLLRIGTAAFADIGSAWDKGEDPRWLHDVGAGLRIVSTRQAAAKVLHIDLAAPLIDTNGIDKVQLVVTAKTQF